jgi:hypothetical protein
VPKVLCFDYFRNSREKEKVKVDFGLNLNSNHTWKYGSGASGVVTIQR